jgi:hypothetical protein
MIATSRKSITYPTVSRHYEFSRIEDQTLASAYQALIPVVLRRLEHPLSQRGDREVLPGVHRPAQRLATGA